MTIACRCKNCGTRKSLNHKPDWYIRQPKCPSCGLRAWRIDKYRIRREYAPGCNCGGYHFPHREGSKFCHYNPDYEDAINNEGKYRE